MRNLSYSFVFCVGIGFFLAGCETAKVADSTVGDGSRNAVSSPTTNASKPVLEQAQASVPVSAPVAKPVELAVAPVVKPDQLFSEGKELYEKGDYRGAIRKLTSARDAADDTPVVKQNSLKYLAFSYCVTSQKPLCKVQFSSLLKLSPSFELSRGEAGHPLWGPVFKEAKAATVKSSK